MTSPSFTATWPTRAPYLLSAFIVAGEMAVAYFYGHAPQGFWPVLNQGHPAILFCFIWLYFSAAGPGPWSLDAKRGK
jgi:putative oxidoreductase